MTNKELITLLKKYPPNYNVIIFGSGCTLKEVVKNIDFEEIYLKPVKVKLEPIVNMYSCQADSDDKSLFI
jgi:hypothetical protein